MSVSDYVIDPETGLLTSKAKVDANQAQKGRPHYLVGEADQRRAEWGNLQAKINEIQTSDRYRQYTNEAKQEAIEQIKSEYFGRLASWEAAALADAQAQRAQQRQKFDDRIRANRQEIAKGLAGVEMELAKLEWDHVAKNAGNVRAIDEAYDRADPVARLVAQTGYLADLAKARHPSDPGNGSLEKKLRRDQRLDYVDPPGGETTKLVDLHTRLQAGLKAARSVSRDVWRDATGFGGFMGQDQGAAYKKMDEVLWQISADLKAMTGDDSDGFIAPVEPVMMTGEA